MCALNKFNIILKVGHFDCLLVYDILIVLGKKIININILMIIVLHCRELFDLNVVFCKYFSYSF